MTVRQRERERKITTKIVTIDTRERERERERENYCSKNNLFIIPLRAYNTYVTYHIGEVVSLLSPVLL